MRLELTRSGGLANLRLRRSLDTEALPPEEGRRIEELLDGLDLEDLERRSPLLGRGADRFQYDLRVLREGGERRVLLAETEAPAGLATVIDEVLRRGEEV